MNPASDHRVLTWRRLLVAAAAGLLVLSLGQAILRGDHEALALVVVIVVGLVLLRRGTGVEAPLGGTREATFTAAPGSYRFYCRVPPTPPPACKAP